MILRAVVIVALIRWVEGLSESRCSVSCYPNPAVKIRDGCMCGTKMPGLNGDPFEAFLGIPYAKPPVEELRFANLVRNDPWKGIYNTTYPKEMCIQKNDFVPRSIVEGVEDCLYLNVFRPKSVSNPLPVMVFIHGGGYLSGSSHPSQYGPERIMDTRQVVLVTFQYRLGAFGFLSTNDLAAPGNFGLKDQALALRWVQRNIRQFDGDPYEVTLFGHSAGATSVQLHMMSPLSERLFARSISMSGSALAGWNDPPEDPLSLVKRQAQFVGVEDADTMNSWELVEALRKVDAVKLTESRDLLKRWNNYPIVLYTPVVEREFNAESFMREDPRKLWREGLYENVPWMTGYLPNDGAIFALGMITNPLAFPEFLNRQQELLPSFGLNISYDALISRFFANVRVDPDNANLLNKLLNEGSFLYPILESIQQYQNYTYWGKKPVFMYKFNFKGRYPIQNRYTTIPSTKDYGIVHGSELLYLFRMLAVFPDFERNSPKEAMSRELVRHFVQFAVNGTLPSDYTHQKGSKCKGPLERLELVEFTNSNKMNNPVKVKTLNCYSKEFKYLLDVLSWWSNKVQ